VPKHFNITKEQLKSIRDDAHWEQFIRKFEIDKIMGGFGKKYFDKGLELGCGSGKASKHLAYYCKKLFALEYNENLLIEQSGYKVTFMVGDAQELSQFGDGEMDLIYSSSLIEHLPDVDKCLAECGRVLKQDGLIIHTVPNRIWKMFNLLLYYPFGIKMIFGRFFSKNKSQWTGGPRASRTGFDSSLRPVESKLSIKKNLWPKTHGVSKGHFVEYMRWGQKQWAMIFERNSLEVVKVVRLPFYFGWGYNFRMILRLGNYLGLSSCTAYILKKAVK
jgi:ubiquinone/menaquinone biosynthesis C-methylase UbiE